MSDAEKAMIHSYGRADLVKAFQRAPARADGGRKQQKEFTPTLVREIADRCAWYIGEKLGLSATECMNFAYDFRCIGFAPETWREEGSP